MSCQVDILIAQISLNSNQRELEAFQTFFNSIKCVGALQPMTIYFTIVAKKLFNFKQCLYCITFYKLSQLVGHNQLHRRIHSLPMFSLHLRNQCHTVIPYNKRRPTTTITPQLCPSAPSPQVSLAFPSFANQSQVSEELQRMSVLPRAISSGLWSNDAVIPNGKHTSFVRYSLVSFPRSRHTGFWAAKLFLYRKCCICEGVALPWSTQVYRPA